MEEPSDTQPVLEIREVIISATKTEIPVKQVTSAVEIITGEQMQQRKLQTVAEALRWAQGLSVNQSGGPGTTVDVRMRGGTPEQTLVLIDGAIVNSATIGSYDFANLTSDNIDRIEILRGNQSMLWGADAMGGVINITTKRGRDTPNISAFSEYGSFQTIRAGATSDRKEGTNRLFRINLPLGYGQLLEPSIIGAGLLRRTDFITGKGLFGSELSFRKMVD